MSCRAMPIPVAKLLPLGWMLNPESVAFGGSFRSATLRSWPLRRLYSASIQLPSAACRTMYKEDPSREKPNAAGADPLTVL